MISKPVKWRRVGIAALAALSLGLTALAAQVSPPNAAAAPHTAIELPAATLDRFVGSYRLSDQMVLEVKHEGAALKAKLTGQPWFEIFPESESRFFWKIVDAQLEFANDGSGLAPSATLHQFGKDMPLTRIDAGTAAQVETVLQTRVQSQTAAPGSEAALRHYIDSLVSGKPDYARMEPALADATRDQMSTIDPLMKQYGAAQTVTFKGVGDAGWDSYEVQHAHGKLTYKIVMASNGKIAGLLTMASP